MELALVGRHTQSRGKPRTSLRPAPPLARPGWFPDPADLTSERFWTGTIWTGLTRPLADSYVVPVAGMARTLFDHAIQHRAMRSRRLVVTENSIRWGRFTIGLSEITAVSHVVKSDPRDGRWTRLAFRVESRLGTLRIDIHGVTNEEARMRAYDGYRALVSAASTIVIPRLAVEVVDRVEAGHTVNLGPYRLTDRGLSLRHRKVDRHPLSGRWFALRLDVDATGQPMDASAHNEASESSFVRTADGLKFPAPDPGHRATALLPLVLWLAQDRFNDQVDLRAA
jgi:Protein of unknown function (DUF2510)